MSSDSDTSKVELTSRQPRARTQVKIPPYTGREDWAVCSQLSREVRNKYKKLTKELSSPIVFVLKRYARGILPSSTNESKSQVSV